MASKGKGGRKGSKQQHNEGQKTNQNRFQALEENEEMANEDQSMEEGPIEEEKEENYNPTQEICNKKDTMMSETELEMDIEMTQSETNLEDHKLQEILKKGHLDLEGLLMQGITGGIDSLPQEDCNRIHQLFLWKTQEIELGIGKTSDK